MIENQPDPIKDALGKFEVHVVSAEAQIGAIPTAEPIESNTVPERADALAAEIEKANQEAQAEK